MGTSEKHSDTPQLNRSFQELHKTPKPTIVNVMTDSHGKSVVEGGLSKRVGEDTMSARENLSDMPMTDLWMPSHGASWFKKKPTPSEKPLTTPSTSVLPAETHATTASKPRKPSMTWAEAIDKFPFLVDNIE